LDNCFRLWWPETGSNRRRRLVGRRGLLRVRWGVHA
jgi:hypothetical protein